MTSIAGQASGEELVEAGHQEHSVTRAMIAVFAALCVLTCASLLTYTDFWQQRVPMEVGRGVMLAVSVCKAFLVATFFMHLWWEKSWKWIVTIPALCVSTLLCVALVPDIGRRTLQYENLRWMNAAEPMPYHVGEELLVSQPKLGGVGEKAGHELRKAEPSRGDAGSH